jgi:hypothetical protein
MRNLIDSSPSTSLEQIEAIQAHLIVVKRLYALLNLYAGKFNYGIHGGKILQIQKVLYSIRIEKLTIIKVLEYLLKKPFNLEIISPKQKPMEFKPDPCSKEKVIATYNDLMAVFEEYQKFPQSACSEKINKLLKDIKGFDK